MTVVQLWKCPCGISFKSIYKSNLAAVDRSRLECYTCGHVVHVPGIVTALYQEHSLAWIALTIPQKHEDNCHSQKRKAEG